jgi:hypothetical protein
MRLLRIKVTSKVTNWPREKANDPMHMKNPRARARRDVWTPRQQRPLISTRTSWWMSADTWADKSAHVSKIISWIGYPILRTSSTTTWLAYGYPWLKVTLQGSEMNGTIVFSGHSWRSVKESSRTMCFAGTLESSRLVTQGTSCIQLICGYSGTAVALRSPRTLANFLNSWQGDSVTMRSHVRATVTKKKYPWTGTVVAVTQTESGHQRTSGFRRHSGKKGDPCTGTSATSAKV